MSDLNIAVVGAGVVGLTTAVELQKSFRQAKVTIFADKFNAETTSHVAAGLFRPGTSFCGPTQEVTRTWIIDAYNYWDDIRKSVEAAGAGVAQLSGYIYANRHPEIVRNHLMEDIVPIYRRATEEELSLGAGDWKYGSFLTTLLIQCTEYLPWATRKFIENGGTIQEQTIKSLSSIGSNYDILVNCTGLGAKFLCNDHQLVPMRGQVLKVEAPWIKSFFFGEYDTYIIPGLDSVTLGGCRQFDSFDTSINKYDTLSIKERCEALLPSLKQAKLLAVRVGLRPHRNIVRVEKELQNFQGKQIKIVHNYGHGGFGVTMAPGTSLHAVKLVREILSGTSKL